MALIDNIESEWAVDSKIDPLDLERSSIAKYELHSKYSKYHNGAKRRLVQLQNEKSKLLMHKNDYFMGNIDHATLKEFGWKPNARVYLKTDLPMFIAADDDIIAINLKIAEVDQIVSFLDSIIRMINNRDFTIKNIIENRKFLSGGH